VSVSGEAAERPLGAARTRALAGLAAWHAAPVLAWALLVIVVYFVPAARQVVWTRGAALWFDSFQGDVTLPFLGEAVRAALGALAAAAAATLSAILVGTELTRRLRWRFEPGAEALVVRAVLGIALFSLFGLALAAVGAYRPGVLRASIAAPLLVGAVRRVRRGVAHFDAAAGVRVVARTLRSPWVWFVALALACALVGALAPETEYDAVWYHLYFPRRALEVGRLVDLPDEYVSLYPMGWGMWYGFGLALGGAAAAKLLHFACLPLLAALVHRLARLAVPAASPWLAVALLVAVPTVLWEATTAYTDLAFTLFFTLALLAVLRLDEVRGRGERGIQWLVVGALGLGSALATKHLGLLAGAVLCPTLALLLWTRDRRAGRAIGTAAALGLLALLPALPWYVRATLATGNPVYPELWSVLGGPTTRWDAEADAGLRRFFARFGDGRGPRALLLLPWNVTMHAARYGGAPGPLFLALLPGVALVRPSRAVATLLGVSLAWLALWASPLASFQLRWLLPVAPAVAVLAAAAAARLHAAVRGMGGTAAAHAARWGVVVLLVLSLPPFVALHERDRAGRNGWVVSVAHGLPLGVVAGGESRDAYLARAIPSYHAWQWANAALPAGARVLTWSGGDHLYAHRDRIGVFAPRARPAGFGLAPADSAWRRLRALGITHLLIDERFLAENAMGEYAWDDFAVPGAALRGRCCTRLWHDGRVGVYRVAPLAP